MQRVVSRSEIQSESEASSQPDSDEDFAEKLKHLEQLEFTQRDIDTEEQRGIPDEDEELDFRLFAAPGPSSAVKDAGPSQRIRLKSPTIEHSNPGFIQPNRASNYYFQNAPSQVEKENIESSALTGEEIVKLSRSHQPGTAYNWKVLHLPASGLSKALRTAENSEFRRLIGDNKSQKRKRPGKKARIKVRVKQQVRQKRELDSKAAAEAKEAADKEKRTQRNREKKVKAKMREKAKTAAAAGDDADLQSTD